VQKRSPGTTAGVSAGLAAHSAIMDATRRRAHMTNEQNAIKETLPEMYQALADPPPK